MEDSLRWSQKCHNCLFRSQLSLLDSNVTSIKKSSTSWSQKEKNLKKEKKRIFIYTGMFIVAQK